MNTTLLSLLTWAIPASLLYPFIKGLFEGWRPSLSRKLKLWIETRENIEKVRDSVPIEVANELQSTLKELEKPLARRALIDAYSLEIHEHHKSVDANLIIFLVLYIPAALLNTDPKELSMASATFLVLSSAPLSVYIISLCSFRKEAKNKTNKVLETLLTDNTIEKQSPNMRSHSHSPSTRTSRTQDSFPTTIGDDQSN